MRVIAGFIVAGLVIVWSQVAIASEAHSGSNGSIIITDHEAGEPGANGTAEPGKQVFAYWAVAWAEGGFCRDRRYTYDQAEADAYQYAYNRQVAEANGLAQLPECPRDNPTPAAPSPGDLARDFWDVRRLPTPTLEVIPDYAVSGKRVYLTIKGPATADFHVPNPLGGDVSIAATSRYTVDWGDGSPPTTTTSQGGPWPDGDVTHVYDVAGRSATIRVVQTWGATWSAPGAGGTLDNLQTVGELVLRVEQVQAVRNR